MLDDAVMPLSPPQLGIASSAAAWTTCSPKTLFHLIATLNATFPDYDFRRAKSHDFCKEDLKRIRAHIHNMMQTELPDVWPTLANRFWNAVDHVIDLNECDVYSYIAETDADNPYGEEGCLYVSLL